RGACELSAGRDRGRVDQHGNPSRLRDELMQNFKSFNVKLRGENAYPGGIAAGPRQAGHQATADHIVGHSDDRDCLRRVLHSSDGRVAKGDDEVNVVRNELASQRRRALATAFSPSKQEADIASLFPADRLHVAPERLGECLNDVLAIGPQYADHRYRLRARRERPRCGSAAEQRDELAASHYSITSSASASIVGGISSPRILAALRLTTNSNFTDCMTGKSAGFSPWRILPA